MAENEETEVKESRSGNGMLVVILAALLSLLLGAGGMFFFLGGTKAPAATKDPAAEAPTAAAGEQDVADRVFSLDPFVVNISGDGYPRYLKLKVAFLMNGEDGRKEIEQRVAQVRDTTIILLSSKRLADIDDFEGKALLKDDLRKRVNALMSHGRVQSVLFTEFVIQ